MRTLASIKPISKLLPIEGRDRIELAIIDGWSVIVKKGEFEIGDKCVYVEIDSILPDKPEFDFLRSKGFRIKTMKMAGVISQGICFPLSILPHKIEPTISRSQQRRREIQGYPPLYKTSNDDYSIGDDVTDILGVTQYEATMDKEQPAIAPERKNKYPEFLMRMKWFRNLVLPKKESKGFPPFISKTDETRIQNMPFILNDKREWVATEKVDGQSGTFALLRHKSKVPFIKDKFEYIVCSRNLRLYHKDNSSYWAVSDKYNIEGALRNMIGDKEWIAIQGECVAPNVQKNKYNVSEPDLYIFNLIYPSGRIASEMAKNICNQHGMKFVPIIDTKYVLPDTVQEVLTYATAESKLYTTLREGIVFRSKDGKQSFKAVSPEFLLKWDE